MFEIIFPPFVDKIMTGYEFLKFVNSAGTFDFSGKFHKIRTSQPEARRERLVLFPKRPADLNLHTAGPAELDSFNKDHLVSNL